MFSDEVQTVGIAVIHAGRNKAMDQESSVLKTEGRAKKTDVVKVWIGRPGAVIMCEVKKRVVHDMLSFF